MLDDGIDYFELFGLPQDHFKQDSGRGVAHIAGRLEIRPNGRNGFVGNLHHLGQSMVRNSDEGRRPVRFRKSRRPLPPVIVLSPTPIYSAVALVVLP